MSVHFKYR